MSSGRHSGGWSSTASPRRIEENPAPTPSVKKTRNAPFAVAGMAAVAMAAIGGSLVPGGQQLDAANRLGPDPVVGPDQQLDAFRRDASAVDQRASRAQREADEEIKQRIADKKAAARKAAEERAERLRPKYFSPIDGSQRLGKGYGAYGPKWGATGGKHTGQDFRVPMGTPIHAVADGTVVEVKQLSYSFGYYIRLRHEDGTESVYAHLSSFKVRRGPVKAGQVIAYSGRSGNTGGYPHLHFEVQVNGDPVNPMSWLRRHGVDV